MHEINDAREECDITLFNYTESGILSMYSIGQCVRSELYGMLRSSAV